MIINIRIDRKFESNFSDYYPSIDIEIPDRRFEDKAVKGAIEKIINNMLDVDIYRTSGRAIVKVDEAGMSYYATFTEKFELFVDFCEMKGKATFKRSNRGASRLI